jgi:hypothetical protein
MSVLEVPSAAENLNALGYRVFRLPERIASRAEFFGAMRALLPLDPPMQSDRSWDALSDSLWGGLDALPEARIALLWSDSATLKSADPDDFELAVDVLEDVCRTLADVASTPTPKDFVVLLG